RPHRSAYRRAGGEARRPCLAATRGRQRRGGGAHRPSPGKGKTALRRAAGGGPHPPQIPRHWRNGAEGRRPPRPRREGPGRGAGVARRPPRRPRAGRSRGSPVGAAASHGRGAFLPPHFAQRLRVTASTRRRDWRVSPHALTPIVRLLPGRKHVVSEPENPKLE